MSLVEQSAKRYATEVEDTDQDRSKAPCAIPPRFKATLPNERIECAILPPETPSVGSPARRSNELVLEVILWTSLSDPHSAA